MKHSILVDSACHIVLQCLVVHMKCEVMHAIVRLGEKRCLTMVRVMHA